MKTMLTVALGLTLFGCSGIRHVDDIFDPPVVHETADVSSEFFEVMPRGCEVEIRSSE